MIEAKMTRRSFMGAAAVSALSLAACGGNNNEADTPAADADGVKITMVTDTGGVNDQSFNQLAWAGLEQLKADNGWEVDYIESKQDADYATNLDKAVDAGCKIVWGIGFAMSEAINTAAEQNPDVQFASIEGTNENGAENLVAVAFKSQEPSFVVGYIAACMSKKGKVGFIGGMESETIAAFEYGFAAGVEYANKEKGTKVVAQSQYAESFTDAAKGKSIAQKMISDGCDVLFHAAGGVGVGMLEACAEAKDVYSIGVDQDQAAIFPENETIITSALKRVDQAVIMVSSDIIDDQGESGNIVLGAAEDAVGLAETHDRLPDDVYNEALGLFEQIKSGTIEPPASKEDFEAYKASL